MKKRKNIFARNQRKPIFKSKGFKQALSLIMILFMCLVLLPIRPIEAAGENSFNTNRIYIDVNGMNKNSSCNFANYDNVKIVALNAGDWTPVSPSGRETIDDIEYFYWDISYWSGTDKEFAILYNDWGTANNNDWARTNAVATFNNAKGKAFYWDGSENEYINGKHVYRLIEGVREISKAGKSLEFVDMTGTLDEITAVFATDENFEDFKEVHKQNGKFIIPNDKDTNPYKYVKFKNSENYITNEYKVTSSVKDGTNINISLGNSVLYYGATEKSDGTKYSYWGKENTNSSGINGNKLYLDKALFLSNKETKIQIGNRTEEKLNADTNDEATLSYTINDSTATQKTIITVITSDNTKYHFFWSDLSKNLLAMSGNVAVVSGTYSKSYTVYFDATLSKLSYKVSSDSEHKEDKPNLSIPMDDGKVYCYLWNKNNTSENSGQKEMTKVSITKGNNSWTDLYKIDLTEEEWNKYSGVVFFSTDCNNSNSCNKTIDLTIDKSISSPCFYADDSDDIIYSTTKRNGYWDNVCTIRDPEKQGGSNDSIVDISQKTFVKDTKAKYVTTTFYDFYSVYELNGKNRDSYNYSDTEDWGNEKGIHDKVYIHRFYQPFRQFNQALSSYYDKNQALDPIYWGNFQNYAGSKFSSIAGTLNLYGYNTTSGYPANEQAQTYSKFFFNNNSMWGYGANIATYDSDDNKTGAGGRDTSFEHGKNAVLGLVKDTLDSDGNLQIESGNSGTIKAPYFDEDFLNGNNSKNTKLGKVYKDVDFPFQSVKLKSKSNPDAKGEVDYWVFDSRGRKDEDGGESISGMSLEMKQDPDTKEYYLENRGDGETDKVKGELAEGLPTAEGNFFPFNKSVNEVSGNLQQSGKAARLNYGFAMKMGFDFRLTENGMVKTDLEDEIPIEFNFSGDDDVWVFIDGKLVLDIGGGHGRVEGTLNFSQEGSTDSGKTKIQYTISSTKNNTSEGGLTSDKTETLEIDGSPTSTHKLTMFYMERGLWESNMRVTFNFPDDNTFQVEKQIDTTDVNEIFQDTFTNNTDKLFTFNIQNKVTHYGAKDATTETADVSPVVFNDTLQNDKLRKGSDSNTFYHVDNFEGHSNVALWNAKLNDESFQYKDKRFGIVSPANGETISIPAGDKFLQFDCYLQNNENLAMKDFYIELEDSSGKKITGQLDSSKTKGISEVKMNQWQTVTIDLTKLQDSTAYNNFDFTQVKYFKFDCCYTKNIYLDNIKFIPEEKVSAIVGFKTKQDQIPDYGSASGSELKNATNAVFELKNNKDNSSNYERVDENGNFMLGDKQVATFSNQFRRGSYISVSEEGVNPEIFTTKWTILEKNQPVERFGNSTTKVTNPNPIPSLVDRDDLFIENSEQKNRDIPIDDGRTEKTDNESNAASYTGTRPTGNTIVFRSYKSPDDETSNVKIKALFVNKVRTGKIAIAKIKAPDSPNLSGEYTFRVTFTNVAGMSMESDKIVKEYTLKVGETKEITGIPAGTKYYIEEISASDSAKVESIEVDENNKGNDEYTINSENKTVTGTVKADDETGTTATKYTFANTTRKKISIALTKEWKDENGNLINGDDSSLPESIKVQLQRKIKGSQDDFKSVSIDGKDYVEVEPSYGESGDIQWKYTFSNLDKYSKIDESGLETGEYEYRVVEVEVDEEGKVTIPKDNVITLNEKDYDINLGELNVDESDNTKYNTTITNKEKLCSIEITKVDLESGDTISNSVAKFKIQKLKDESKDKDVNNISDSDYDGNSETKETENGVLKFTSLRKGTYLITEIEAPSGYIKLKDPFKITVPCEYSAGTIVDGIEALEDGTKTDIKLKVYNPKGAVLPVAGFKGIQLYLLIGILTMLFGAGVFTVVKLRKSKKIN